MAQQETAIIVLLTLGGTGLLLLVVGIFLIIRQNMKVKKCQEKTYGVVVGYKRRSRELIVPVVEYHVFGNMYQKTRNFRAVISKSWRRQDEEPVTISENDYVFLRGRIMTQKMAEKIWPINMQMSVYYDPIKPQRAFVEKIPNKTPVVSIVFISLAIFLIVLALLLFYLLKG
ncbi:hypothetical protein NMU03_07695 [Allocoprobacillus halotolerans]|uniref:DUF3592 domain-containing protein n=1 Tax=Allocoprobacillus halotolerans TaxID=2944914 RepID=A0ABY5I5K6_9FIRM|nr:DUF3592 domain-containing protein [Allocoprobacillus halotolerans]UTY40639.1 hypothetical protein NMU03_07695 [Allocoprobacillus halotolerans]